MCGCGEKAQKREADKSHGPEGLMRSQEKLSWICKEDRFKRFHCSTVSITLTDSPMFLFVFEFINLTYYDSGNVSRSSNNEWVICGDLLDDHHRRPPALKARKPRRQSEINLSKLFFDPNKASNFFNRCCHCPIFHADEFAFA